ncbi:MAG: coenzyme F420-0:L-glutamate ligase [Promethearchaeia archaeon]
MKNKIELIGLENFPLVEPGDDIPSLILNSLNDMNEHLKEGDIILIAQSIISKSNNFTRDLGEISPSEQALRIYERVKSKAEKKSIPVKSPQLIEVILQESKEVLKSEHVIITETKQGFICANAGIDASNIKGKESITVLPPDSDKIATKIRKKLYEKTKKKPGVIITDSFGRPFRVGSVGVAIGISGIMALKDERGKKDLYGKRLKSTIVGQVDNLASAAQLIMGEADEGYPVVLLRGYNFTCGQNDSINSILRNKKSDLFRPQSREKVVEKVLKERRSYKLPFSEREINEKTIKECIEIACWAPSAHNGQFWRYSILKKGNKLRKHLITQMNQKLEKDLKRDGRSRKFISKQVNKTKQNFLNAPYLILLSLDKTDLEDYPDERRMKNEFLLGVQSISASATYFMLALQSRGLASCWYCAPLFAKEIVKEILNIPGSFHPMAFITVGYPRKKVEAPFRKDINEVIYKLKNKG